MPDNLTVILSRIVDLKIKFAEERIMQGDYAVSNRQDFRDAFVHKIYEAFRREGWKSPEEVAEIYNDFDRDGGTLL